MSLRWERASSAMTASASAGSAGRTRNAAIDMGNGPGGRMGDDVM